jgi:hypothetical protein
MKAGDTVFKVGRSSGVTVGRVDASKVSLAAEALIGMKVLPTDGMLQGHKIASAKEWNVSGLEEWGKGEWLEVAQFASPGDSGAWVVNRNAELVGMVYCGMETETHGYVQDIHMIRESVHQVAQVKLAFPA